MTEYDGASTAAIQRHYDLGNDFYALWLDKNQIYSCAMWSEQDTLEQAQLAKLDYLIAGARASGVKRVLDVGCGWGALLRRLAGVYGVEQAVGLTLSRAQYEHISAGSEPGVEARLENWIEHQPDEPYDAIISIGAFEHFAEYGMSRAERIAAYRTFFARCQEWLPTGGRLALQTIVKGNNTKMSRQTVRDLLFIIDRIFTESELPWLSEIFEASERLFDVITVTNDADDYARTCAAWRARMDARAAEARALVGDDAVADYQRYLTASSEAFSDRHIGLARIIFEKR
ncbi:cyclopropane-fatty-acyl-phospholipid synthase [Nocardia tenerifensis]|uniref:Cyclopropane-fatty-acyl-phospholipid synthase n=1 Tax=Nocardia tenerifensis TaxID=228006 RepID=A0A318JTW5_9NOCA|nr:cyclopropane-fatty-acyl-phospholipid synthase family protein [Nocardia tenerifensis]PXX54888.1 cyclopropane-fatty-acyl-phospholipid synthase [Nocardia tenerifensis]